jgi:hypothetical protein
VQGADEGRPYNREIVALQSEIAGATLVVAPAVASALVVASAFDNTRIRADGATMTAAQQKAAATAASPTYAGLRLELSATRPW